MLNPELIGSLNQRISQALEQKPQLPGEEFVKEQVQAALHSTISRLDLVTREEFDAQQAVLMRTRERLEALEKQVELLLAQNQKEAD